MKRAVQSAYRPRVCVCVLSVMCFASAVVFVGVAREKRGRAGLQSTFVLGVCEEGESESERERERERGFGVGEPVSQARCCLRNTVCGKVLTGSGSRGYYDGYGW